MTSLIVRRLVGVVAGLALALGLAFATTAPAEAKKTVWDRVAKCESGNRWKINTGNGYYGGLQFSRSTWRAYGGRKYGRTANKASKAEQIAIARRVLHGQGAGAWPVCSRKAGLTKSNGKASRRATPGSNPGGGGSEKSDRDKVSSKKSSKADKKTTSKSKSSSGTKTRTIKVKRGDTLGKIADRYDVRGGWKAVWRLNKKRLDSPHSLEVGQRLKIKR